MPLKMQRKPKIFVSTVPFGAVDPAPLDMLAATGWDVLLNPAGRKLTSAEVAEMAKDCDGIVAGTESLTPLLQANSGLKVISRVGVGLDSVPLKECRRRGIAVSYTPDAVTMAVAEFAIGAMIGAMRHVLSVDRAMRTGEWRRSQGIRLGEATVGLRGFGRIGSNVARLLLAFNPRQVLVNDIKDKSAEVNALRDKGLNIRLASASELLSESDVLSLHVPLSRATRGMIGASEFDKMKPQAVLVNTARGGVVDEVALFAALKGRRIAAAAVDVFEEEPYRGPLLSLENAILTAHLGSCSVDCRARMETEATADLIRFLSDEPLMSPVPEEEYDN